MKTQTTQTQTQTNFLNQFTFKKTYLRKSCMTSGNAYLITIKNLKNNHIVRFIFNDNVYNESTLIDFLKSLEIDSNAFYYCYNLDEFMNEYGCTERHEAQRIFNACKKQFKRYTYLLSSEEIKTLQEIEY